MLLSRRLYNLGFGFGFVWVFFVVVFACLFLFFGWLVKFGFLFLRCSFGAGDLA